VLTRQSGLPLLGLSPPFLNLPTLELSSMQGADKMPEEEILCDTLTNKSARVRQFHTRSKTGCSSCRTRRKRCDEQRPEW
jgi:hypothetical protein